MKIIGGSFGNRGSAYIADKQLVVEGARKAYYEPPQVQRVQTRIDAERRFGLIGAVVAGFILAVVGWFILAIFGALIGVAIAVAGSFYTSKKNIAELTFTDGSTLSLECTPRAIEKLVRFNSGG